MKKLWIGGAFFAFFYFYLCLHGVVWNMRSDARRIAPPGYVLPTQVNKLISLGQDGLFADFLFLKTTIFFGERFGLGNDLDQKDWDFIVANLEAVTDLDPLFLDPYIFSQGVLAWDANMPEKAIAFLDKGFRHNPDQWRLAFYIGFDYYHLLGDFKNGADYITKASKIPGSYSFLPTLAARLYYYGDKSKTAIIFLKDMISTTRDPVVLARLKTRLLALEGASLLEDLLEQYEKDHGKQISDLQDLLKDGYLEKFPEEPYGGKWVVLESGRVFSTSRFALRKTNN